MNENAEPLRQPESFICSDLENQIDNELPWPFNNQNKSSLSWSKLKKLTICIFGFIAIVYFGPFYYSQITDYEQVNEMSAAIYDYEKKRNLKMQPQKPQKKTVVQHAVEAVTGPVAAALSGGKDDIADPHARPSQPIKVFSDRFYGAVNGALETRMDFTQQEVPRSEREQKDSPAMRKWEEQKELIQGPNKIKIKMKRRNRWLGYGPATTDKDWTDHGVFTNKGKSGDHTIRRSNDEKDVFKISFAKDNTISDIKLNEETFSTQDYQLEATMAE